MRVGIFGFGKAGRSVATVFLQHPDTVLGMGRPPQLQT